MDQYRTPQSVFLTTNRCKEEIDTWKKSAVLSKVLLVGLGCMRIIFLPWELREICDFVYMHCL